MEIIVTAQSALIVTLDRSSLAIPPIVILAADSAAIAFGHDLVPSQICSRHIQLSRAPYPFKLDDMMSTQTTTADGRDGDD